MISVFDIYKVGIGPSSSHTGGPMKAGKEFIDELRSKGKLRDITRITVDLYGALSLTGKGHNTDIAIIMGLAGNLPEDVDIESIPGFIARLEKSERLPVGMHCHTVSFPHNKSIHFHDTNLALHENGMQIHAWIENEKVLSKTYYSIGGGFIVDEEHFGKQEEQLVKVPYEYSTAEELIKHCKAEGLSISSLVLENEKSLRPDGNIQAQFTHIWKTMRESMDRGMNTQGVLPGPMRIPRRAAALCQQLVASESTSNDPMAVIDWVNMFAFAVSEENASGGRVVTAPTNGACGIVPAVIAYYDKFIHRVTEKDYMRFLAASGAIGGLFKQNASISGAEVGCQGEVGVACSMAAAGLVELLGGSPEQVCIAAEIGMEHNLGLTCDPVSGRVQIPCIERNGINAVKAINSARMALRRSSDPLVSLDKVIETMMETGKDMNSKYRETSLGGLAIKVLC
jgi:L-serine dehydratase